MPANARQHAALPSFQKAYWVVDPANATLEIYTLREGVFARHGVYGEGHSFECKAVALTGGFAGENDETA